MLRIDLRRPMFPEGVECTAEFSYRVRAWAGAAAAALVLSGCATVPANTVDASASLGDDLYAGEPETVFATEFPVESAEDARQRAAEALRTNDIDRALYFYVQAVNLEPDDAESLYMIGAIHEGKGNKRLAGRAYARAVEIDPHHALALQGLGVAYFELHDAQRARETLERAVAVEPKLWRAHNILGVIADTRGEHAAAVEHFSTALELRPRTASILSNRGYSYYMAEDFTAAERDFAAAISADASYDQARRNLGLLYARQRRYDAAFDELAQVTSRHVAANDVGYIAMLAEDYAVAERYFTEALNLSPRHYATAEENMNKLRRLRQSKLVVER